MSLPMWCDGSKRHNPEDFSEIPGIDSFQYKKTIEEYHAMELERFEELKRRKERLDSGE